MAAGRFVLFLLGLDTGNGIKNGNTIPANALFLEDGVTPLMLEDGVTYLTLEA